MRKLMLAFLVVMGLAMPMAAELCTPDAVPAASLLLPYFEVDIENPDGVTTLFSINNASFEAALAHVTLWTDLSVPVLDFDVYLTGYDVVTINLRDIIINGVIPRTADDARDPSDSISNQGLFSDDVTFASCAGALPPPATIGSLYTSHLQASLTGGASALLGGLCSGLNYGDGIARGYVTIDSVNACSILFPGDLGYFLEGGLGLANNQNVLWGDYFHVDSANNFAQGDVLVHLEAEGTASNGDIYGDFFAAGDHTFYGRYVAAAATDGREALPSTYGVRYLNGGAFDGGTQLTIWRESTTPASSPFTCPATIGRPAWYPLGLTQVVVFDEEENPVTQEGCSVSPCPTEDVLAIPAEAQRVIVGSDQLPVVEDFGWLYMNFNTTVAGDPHADVYAQAFVSANMDASGRFSVGFQAVSLNQLCNTGILDGLNQNVSLSEIN
ncbi:MAG: hypothetical protein HYU52_02670 [Acidobacteria bacterium]|nr:hypothetical protein [Acidobacteriota bacterium]